MSSEGRLGEKLSRNKLCYNSVPYLFFIGNHRNALIMYILIKNYIHMIINTT
jgi:hypothetical protein